MKYFRRVIEQDKRTGRKAEGYHEVMARFIRVAKEPGLADRRTAAPTASGAGDAASLRKRS